MREDLIMTEVNRLFAQRVFGPQRRQLFLADLDDVDDTARRERDGQRQRLQRKLADTVRKQDNVLRKPRTPSREGCGSATTPWRPDATPCSPPSPSWRARRTGAGPAQC